MKVIDFANALIDIERQIPEGMQCREGGDLPSRFGVYRNNVVVSLTTVLEENYPVVTALVGSAFFRAMAREFIFKCPPRSPVMYEYGTEFADFVSTYAPASSLPYLSDIARLEWSRVLAYHSPDASSIDLATVQALLNSPERLAASQWQFLPSVSMVVSRYAIVSLWHAHQHASSEQITQALAQFHLDRAETALLFRQGFDVVVLKLNPTQYAFVHALMQGHSLSYASECADHEDQAFDLAHMMGSLFSMGVIMRVLTGDEQNSGLK